MPLRIIIDAIEKKQSLQATELLEKSLYIKAGVLLEEKKKQVSAKTWPAGKEMDKNKEKSERRKVLMEKLKKKKK